MSQWGQGQQPGYQYPMQTGYSSTNPQFQRNPQFQQQNPQQNPQFQQGFVQGLAPQQTGFPGQRPQGFQQPQLTGFPGQSGLLQQHPTGFPSQAGGFQQRPNVPPVPPIPTQYQQHHGSGFSSAPPQLRAQPQQTGFLSSSPGFNGTPLQPMGFTGGLASQPTGFPGRGNGGPLVPQMTGFVDPRLQMMQSTFMPANISAPYNAGGLPQLQPQLQPGGLSLQQSFQQHNQAQRGTAIPKIPWALSKAEKKNYDQIFRAWDAQSTGFISGQTALEVFGQSGLDKNELARIWTLADTDNRGKLNMAEFHVAMGLIYRRLNGNDIPDELPAELVPPSSRDLDTSVNFLKDILKNDNRARSPSSSEGPISRLPERSFNGSNSSRAGGRQDATVYKHSDSEPPGGFYQPRSRHVDRSTVRSNSESDSPAADLSDMKKQLENTARMLDRASEENASRTAEDEALDREMSDLKYRVKRVQEDLEYVSRGPKTSGKDEERRRLERELLKLMHERVPEVERKIEERERRKERERRDWARVRDRRNDRFGRYDEDSGERHTPSKTYDDDRDRPYSRASYDNDDKDYRRDRSRDENYDRFRSPAVRHSPPPPPPPSAVPPSTLSSALPRPTKSPVPSTKNMTPEERQAFIRSEARRRMEERMQALGVVAPTASPALDTSVEDRLAQEKKEAEEKAKAAEKQAEERERIRRERLQGEKALKDGRSTPAPVPPTTPAVMTPAATNPALIPAPLPPKPKAPAPPPPRKLPRVTRPAVITQPLAPPVPVLAPATPIPASPVLLAESRVDAEEEAFRAREEALQKKREERAAQLRKLEEEEEEARQAEEAYNIRREALSRAKSTASTTPSPVPPPPPILGPPTPPPVADVAAPTPRPSAPPVISPPILDNVTSTSLAGDKSSTNPFSKLMTSGSTMFTATPAAAASGNGNNPFFRSQTAPPPSAPTPPKSPIGTSIKTSYHTAPANDDDEWDDIAEKEEDDSSDDEIVSSRSKRDEIAKQLFGNILPPPRPQSAAANITASMPLTDNSPPPPPTAPIAPPPTSTPVAPAISAPPGDRGALLGAIQNGLKLKKTVTNDRSAAPVSGQVLGDNAPPYINTAPRPSSPPVSTSLPPSTMLQGGYSSTSTTAEVDEDEVKLTNSVPQIHVSEPAEGPAVDDPMDDVDKSVEYRVRSLYSYGGQRPEDLAFGENLVLLANPSKTGGDWWYGTLVRGSYSGFFPKSYVQPLDIVNATAIYSYTGSNADELPFEEGDQLSIVDRSEQDWWRAEQDGVIFIVPAAYLEVVEG